MNIVNIIVTYAVCFLPILVIFAIMPYIGRRTLSFGITIPPDAYTDPELVSLRKRFSVGVIWTGLLLCALSVALFFLLDETTAVIMLTVCVFAYIAVISVFYVRCWKAMRHIKQDRGWASAAHQTVVADTKFNQAKRAVSAAWFLLYALIIVGTLVIGIALYDHIPDTVPMQTNMQGEVARYAEKSFNLLLFAPVLQALIALLMGFVYWMMLRTPPVIDPDNPEKSSAQNVAFRYGWSAFIVFGGILLQLIFLVMQLSFTTLIPMQLAIWIPLAGTGLLVLAAIVLSIKTGQSGSRIRVGQTKTGGVINRDDDKYWKWGAFYVNKEDPALFVEKRFGIGFTINFGRPAAVIMFVVLIGLIVGVSMLVSLLAG